MCMHNHHHHRHILWCNLLHNTDFVYVTECNVLKLIVMCVIVDYAKFVGIYIICLCTRLHIPSVSGSLVIAIKRNLNIDFRQPPRYMPEVTCSFSKMPQYIVWGPCIIVSTSQVRSCAMLFPVITYSSASSVWHSNGLSWRNDRIFRENRITGSRVQKGIQVHTQTHCMVTS